MVRGCRSPKTPRLHELFRGVCANFCLLPCDMSQKLSNNCSEKNLFGLTSFLGGWLFLLWLAGTSKHFQKHHEHGSLLLYSLSSCRPYHLKSWDQCSDCDELGKPDVLQPCGHANLHTWSGAVDFCPTTKIAHNSKRRDKI